jgi:VCBS repeat-containing protein
VTEGAPSEYQILHIPSGKHVALSGLDYVQFSDMTVHGDFLARTNPDLQRPTSQDQTEFLLQAEEPAVNDAPVAGNVDLGASPEDTALTITEAQLLAASSDVDGDLSVSALSVDPAAGTLTDNADGTWTFTPAADLNVDDLAFAFTVSDGSTTDSATATLDVTAVNDAPVAGNVDLGASPEDTALTITEAQLLAASSDVDGDKASRNRRTEPWSTMATGRFPSRPMRTGMARPPSTMS